MKHDPIKLIYHTMHKRPMPGCLPLFFVLAALVVVGIISLVRVVTPEPLRPRGVGNVYYRNDELTRFQVRQRSAMPLRLPVYADPAARPPIPEHPLDPVRQVELQATPAVTSLPGAAPDSAVLNAESLLALPPEELLHPVNPEEKEVQP